MNKAYAVVLTLPKEVEVTKLSLLSMAAAKKHFHDCELEIQVLLNGPHDHEFQKWCQEHHIFYKCGEKNLGVAGGRNYLIKSLPDDDAYIFILDNDIYLPVDYFSRLFAEYLSLQSENIGLLGATVLEYKQYKKLLEKNFTNDDLKKFSLRMSSFNESVYHCGINEDWGLSYFLTGEVEQWLNHIPRNKDFFQSFNDFFEKNKFIKTSNVIGASQLFTLSLFKQLGGLKDTFNPYGYEDVDFSIKAIKAGKKNFVSSDTFILHGTDERHSQRITSSGIVNKVINDYRSAFHLFLEHAENPDKQFIEYVYFQFMSGRVFWPHIFFAKFGMKKAQKESLEV